MVHLLNSDRRHVEWRGMLLRSLMLTHLRQQLPRVLSKLLRGDTTSGAWRGIDQSPECSGLKFQQVRQIACKTRCSNGTRALVKCIRIACTLMPRTMVPSRMPVLLSHMPALIIEPWREHFTILIRVGKVFRHHFAHYTLTFCLSKQKLLKCMQFTCQITSMRISNMLHAHCKVST